MEIKNSFLAEAIDRLTDLGKKTTEPTTILANGRTFLVTGASCEEIDPIEKPQPDKATTASLNALVALLRNEVDKEYTHCPLYVSCGWYDRVRVFTQPDEGDGLHRFTLYEAVATDLPPLVEEVRWGFDEAQIKLRSMFQRAPEGDTNDVDYILGLLSHMSVDQSVKSDDNGVTQTVQVRKGVSFVENQRVRPIVKLAPYRTFQEVEQPESEFVFRVYDDRSISLTAADGGMWKMAARNAVREYLLHALSGEILTGQAVVTL